MLGIDHVGSAHDAGQLAVLLETAQARLHAGQQMLPLVDGGLAGGRPIGEPVVEGTASLIVWEALGAVYASLGFAQIADNAFKALVLARIIEPTSKLDSLRVLGEGGSIRSGKRPSSATFLHTRPGGGASWLPRARSTPRSGQLRWCSTTSARCTSRPTRVTGSVSPGSPKRDASSRRSRSVC